MHTTALCQLHYITTDTNIPKVIRKLPTILASPNIKYVPLITWQPNLSDALKMTICLNRRVFFRLYKEKRQWVSPVTSGIVRLPQDFYVVIGETVFIATKEVSSKLGFLLVMFSDE